MAKTRTVNVEGFQLCVVNADCPTGQVCVSGTCVDHEPCSAGTHWDESKKACVVDTCAVNTDCPVGQVCQSGICVDHAVCPIGTHWDETQKACVADIPCTIDADCPEGYVCQSGVCVKVSPPPITPLKLVLATLAVFGGGVGLYYGLKGGKKK